MSKYPLGMPKGSVRAILALMLVAGLLLAIWFDVSAESLAIIAGLAGSAITFYFNKRGSDDRAERESN